MREDGPDRIGSRIAQMRNAARVSATELGAIAGAGLTKAVLANLETGRKTDVTVRQLLAIAAALGVPPLDLIVDMTWPNARYTVIEDGDGNVLSLSNEEMGRWLGGSSAAFAGWRFNNRLNPWPSRLAGAVPESVEVLRELDERSSLVAALRRLDTEPWGVGDRQAARTQIQSDLWVVENKLRQWGIHFDEYVEPEPGESADG